MPKKPKMLLTLLWRYLGICRKESCPHSWLWCYMDGIVESAALYLLGKPVWFWLYRRQSSEVEAKRNIPC